MLSTNKILFLVILAIWHGTLADDVNPIDTFNNIIAINQDHVILQSTASRNQQSGEFYFFINPLVLDFLNKILII